MFLKDFDCGFVKIWKFVDVSDWMFMLGDVFFLLGLCFGDLCWY